MKIDINKTKKSSVLLMFTLFILVGCVDLEEQPRGVIIPSATEEFEAIIRGVNKNSILANVGNLMGDDICALVPNIEDIRPFNLNFFSWARDLHPIDEPSRFLSIIQNMIYRYNIVVNNVLDATSGSETFRKQIWSEAKASRAELYLRLITTYGKPYVNETASTDLGVPLFLEEQVVDVSFTRASVQEVYDFIITELEEAIPFMANNISKKARINKTAAMGVLAKAYVDMRNYKAALTYLNKVIDNVTGSSFVQFYNYLDASRTSDDPYGIRVDTDGNAVRKKPKYYENNEIIFGRRDNIVGLQLPGSKFPLNPATTALYGADDYRRIFWARSPLIPGVSKLSLYSGEGDTRRGVTLPMMYLLRAEVKAREGDLAGAIQDIEFLRKYRMPEESARL